MSGPLNLALPPIPAATAGMPGPPNPLMQILQAAAQYGPMKREVETEQAKAKAQEAQAQLTEQSLETQRLKNAHDRQALLASTLASAPDMASHPEYISAVQDTYKQLNLPPPLKAGANGQQMIDVDALRPKQSILAMGPQFMEQFGGMAPELRKPYQKFFYDLTDDMVNAPAHYPLGSAQRTAIEHDEARMLERIGTGQMLPSQFARWIQENRKNLEAIGKNPSVYDDPQQLAGLGAAIQGRLAEYEARGIHLRNQDRVALQNAKTLGDYRKAEEKLLGVRATVLPQQLQEKMRHDFALEAASGRRNDIAAERVRTLASKAATGDRQAMAQLRAGISFLRGQHGVIGQTQAALERAMGIAQQAYNAGNTPPAEVMTLISTLQARLADAQQTADDAERQITPGIERGLSTLMGGKPVRASEPNQKVPPQPQAQATATRRQMPDGRQIEVRGNRWVYSDSGQPVQ